MGSYFNFLIKKTTGKKPVKKINKKPDVIKIPVFTEKSIIKTKPIIKEKYSYTDAPASEHSSSLIAGVAISTLIFLIILTVFGQVQSSLNTSAFTEVTMSLMNIIPLVLVGATILGIIAMAWTLSN